MIYKWGGDDDDGTTGGKKETLKKIKNIAKNNDNLTLDQYGFKPLCLLRYIHDMEKGNGVKRAIISNEA